MFVDIKHVNINACEQAIIKEFEHKGKQSSKRPGVRVRRHTSKWACDHQSMQTQQHTIIETCEHRSMRTSMQVNIGACDHQSKQTSEHVIIKAKTNVRRLSTKHVNIQASDHESIHAYEHLNTPIHIPPIYQSPQHSSTIVNTFKCTNVLLYDRFSLQVNRHFIIQECAYVRGYQTY